MSLERYVRSPFKKRNKTTYVKVGIKKQKRDRQKWTERKKKKEREKGGKEKVKGSSGGERGF